MPDVRGLLRILVLLALLPGCLDRGRAEEDHGRNATLFVYVEERPEKFLPLAGPDFDAPAMKELEAALQDALDQGNVTRKIPAEHVAPIIERLDQKWRQVHGEASAGRRHVEYGGAYFNVRLGSA